MPEYAEVRLCADYINKKCKNLIFTSIKKNSISKQKDINISSSYFKIDAFSRGKELQIHHIDCETNKILVLTITLGMSGNFHFIENKNIKNKWPMLTWYIDDIKRLELVDHRRFAKWKIRDWNSDRGYDMVKEHDLFSNSIKLKYANKCKDFNKPLCEILLSQKYFNGLGNYLLAEILGRLNINPFQPLQDLKHNKLEQLIILCKEIPLESYKIGGGEMKDWKNPENSSKDLFAAWLKFYKHKDSLSIVTKTGRNFWYNKKWKKYNIYEDK
jgi:endonuclease VIII-like 1